MKAEIIKIADELKSDSITIDEAKEMLLALLGIDNSISKEELDNLKYRAYAALPEYCIEDKTEIKFCWHRQGDGNMCKQCSDYND